MEKATSEAIRRLNASLGDLRSVFAPIVPEALANLDGWHWEVNQTTERQLLIRGQEVDVLPIIQKGRTNERGWINTAGIVFSDPDSEMIYSMDNWNFRVSPRFVNTFLGVLPNGVTLYVPVYNPATIFGPLYGLQWSPTKFWPYKTQIVFRAVHPKTAVTPTSQIVAAGIGRVIIPDQRLFYESILIESQKQTIGKVEIHIRRPT